jgi:hypothetical protein
MIVAETNEKSPDAPLNNPKITRRQDNVKRI